MDNYYKDLWTKKGSHGSIFWDKVDFSAPEYKTQEHIFRQTLLSLKNLMRLYVEKREIKSVLELGAGTGRMTKIVLDEFGIDDEGSIMKYDCVDLQYDRLTLAETIGPKYVRKLNWWNMDITGQDFYEIMRGKQYDFVLASEVFMHIKPDDVYKLISFLYTILAPKNGMILNIDWAFEPQESEWCFIHDYHKMYEENGLTPIFTADMDEIQQKLFLYGK